MKKFLFSLSTNPVSLAVVNLSLILLAFANPALASNTVNLYIPYTKISVPPGESIDYTIDIINNTSDIQNIEISISGLPRGWNYICFFYEKRDPFKIIIEFFLNRNGTGQ
jgi:uncharacterized membrane protein